MARLRILGLVTAILLVVAVISAAGGYVVILKSGHKIRCKEPMRIEGPNAILTLATGTLTSYPLQLVDLVETERYNQLGLGDALMIEELSVHGTPIPTPTPYTSLGQHATIDAGGADSPSLGTTVEPTPVPTLPLRRRPYPRCRVIERSACPGRIQTGAASSRPPALRVITSSFWTPRRSAVRGLTRAALSQVSRVQGFGSSCNQPLFEKRHRAPWGRSGS